ncbi:MAG: transcriptional repressor LexA [bacterium]|nr:transcriptional repressor LexA [bacterium]
MDIREQKNKILNFYKTRKRMPGYKEMLHLLGFKSKNAVYKVINKLVEQGILEKDPQGHISPKRLVGEVPMLGIVEAGLPSPAEEQLLETISLDDLLIKDIDKTFILKVKGDSMIEAHIAEGDLVIAEKTDKPKIGDIVVAEVDDEWTLKYLRWKNNKYYLEPANRNYKPIFPKKSLRIGAVVRATIRKYKS